MPDRVPVVRHQPLQSFADHVTRPTRSTKRMPVGSLLADGRDVALHDIRSEIRPQAVADEPGLRAGLRDRLAIQRRPEASLRDPALVRKARGARGRVLAELALPEKMARARELEFPSPGLESELERIGRMASNGLMS